MAIEQQQQQKLFSTLMTAREPGRLSFQEEEDFHALRYVSNHSLNPFHNQDERISFILCVALTIYCCAADRFSKVAGR